jgi:hypothetical protein
VDTGKPYFFDISLSDRPRVLSLEFWQGLAVFGVNLWNIFMAMRHFIALDTQFTILLRRPVPVVRFEAPTYRHQFQKITLKSTRTYTRRSSSDMACLKYRMLSLAFVNGNLRGIMPTELTVSLSPF